jgi:TPR repeat protein
MRIKLWRPTLALAASLVLFPALAHAETPGEACDRLATQSLIKTKPANVKGVKFADIDAKAAIRACAEAIAAHPDVPRYYIQYGRALNKDGKNEQALAAYEAARKAGHWEANIFIGDLYFYGDFGSVDYEKAFALNMEAAEHGVAYAAYTVGIWYRDGLGVAKNREKALSWYRKAYEMGEKEAAIDIGYAYDLGLAVKVDPAEALRWYHIAAANGHGMAMNNIGAFYANGTAVAKDSVKAVAWFRKAQATGNPLAHINLADFTDHGRATEINHALAAEYVLKAFDLGDKWVDPTNRDIVFRTRWTPKFWREVQTRLKERGHYSGPIDGQLTEATKAAFEKIVEK